MKKLKLSLCLVMCALMMSQMFQAKTQAQSLGALSPQAAQRAVGERSRAVVRALKNRDMKTLALYVDAKRGLRFSPYVYAAKSDKVFSVAQVRRLGRDKTRYLWGSYDGSGEPMRLSWSNYRKTFVYPRNFFAITPLFNTFMRRGNLKNNLAQIYPRGVFVEYYSSAQNPKYGGLDWRSLWLVWNRSGNAWKLSAIAGDQWTT